MHRNSYIQHHDMTWDRPAFLHAKTHVFKHKTPSTGHMYMAWRDSVTARGGGRRRAGSALSVDPVGGVPDMNCSSVSRSAPSQLLKETRDRLKDIHRCTHISVHMYIPVYMYIHRDTYRSTPV